jgi:hypothetical protein
LTLSGVGEEEFEEQLTNITYSIRPTYNVTNTDVVFQFRINSFDSQLQWFAFNVTHNGTQLFFQNSTNSTGGNITTIEDLSGLNWNASVVSYASFKKSGYSETWINTSYYILIEQPSGLTDIKSISEWAIDTLDMEESNPYHKFFFGLGFIMLSLVAGTFVSNEGGGFLALGVIGIGLITGLLTFFATGTGIVIGTVFGLLCLAYISWVFMRGGV